MIERNNLKGVIAATGKTQKQLAEEIGLTQQMFYYRMKKGVFGTDEIEKMVDILNIKEPITIFFAQNSNL